MWASVSYLQVFQLPLHLLKCMEGATWQSDDASLPKNTVATLAGEHDSLLKLLAPWEN